VWSACSSSGGGALGQSDAKLVERTVSDMTDLAADSRADLAGYDACLSSALGRHPRSA